MKIKIKKIIASILTFMMLFTQVPVMYLRQILIFQVMEVRIIQVHQEHIIYLEVLIILRNLIHGQMQVQRFVYNIIALKKER